MTCCHGRVASGLRITMSCLLTIDLTISGIIRLTAQSPPPITLPALTDAICNDLEFAAAF